MKPVVIDFLPPRPPPRWAGHVLGALALVALAGLVVLGLKVRELRALEAEVASLQAELQALESAPPPPPPASAPWVPPAHDASARVALAEAEFATAAALTQLERAALAGVTPASVELEAQAGTVQVELEIKDKDALFLYLDALNRQEGPGAPARWKLLQFKPASGERAVGTATIVSVWKPSHEHE